MVLGFIKAGETNLFIASFNIPFYSLFSLSILLLAVIVFGTTFMYIAILNLYFIHIEVGSPFHRLLFD
jgi:hypothetical protein